MNYVVGLEGIFHVLNRLDLPDPLIVFLYYALGICIFLYKMHELERFYLWNKKSFYKTYIVDVGALTRTEWHRLEGEVSKQVYICHHKKLK